VAWDDGSGTTYAAGKSYLVGAAPVSLTALWTRIYNVKYSFNGGSVVTPIADQQKISGDTITVSIAGTGNDYLGLASSYNTADGAVTTGQALITTQTTAMNAITALDSAINNINTARATIGATINRMTYATDNMTNIATNVQASRSTIMDTDYATASTNLSKTQIIQQAATAMLAQANQQPQSVLSLLK
jgi:flagellin